MSITKKVQLNLYVPEHYRDTLQRLAAERMLNDPRRSATASNIGAEIICEYLTKYEKKEINHDETGSGKESE
jgi:hypothetical protein